MATRRKEQCPGASLGPPHLFHRLASSSVSTLEGVLSQVCLAGSSGGQTVAVLASVGSPFSASGFDFITLGTQAGPAPWRAVHAPGGTAGLQIPALLFTASGAFSEGPPG